MQEPQLLLNIDQLGEQMKKPLLISKYITINLRILVCLSLNPFTAVYKCMQDAGGKYGYFDVIIVLHIISYKIITTVGIYTKFFPACLRPLVQCLK